MKKFWLFLAVLFCVCEARVIVDSDGKSIEIPDKIERATPMIGAFVQMSAMLGNEDKIISGASRLPNMMSKIFPKIRTSDNKSGMLPNSVESLIASKTQVVFGPLGVMFDENQIKQLNEAGISVVKIDKFGTIEEIKACVSKIAEIFGDKSLEKAKKFNEYFDENVKFLNEHTSDIKERKRVLVLNFNSGNFSTISSRDIGAEYIKIAGGESLSNELNEESFKISKIISEEQVIIYNPDIIITNSAEGKKQIDKNPSFAFLKAIKNNQVYVVPSGVYLWSVRSAEGALYPLWLAKIFYPEKFKDLNINEKVREFYFKFYNYDLSSEEINTILKGR